MNNSNAGVNNPSNAAIDGLINELYEGFVFSLVSTSAIAFLFYAAILNISDEIEYMWSKRFSLPTLLYLLARYATLGSQAINLTLLLLPETTSTKSCNIIADFQYAVDLLGYIGVQGIFVARSYSLCRGNKVVVAALAVTFFAGIFFQLFQSVAFSGCQFTESSELSILILVTNVSTLLTDFLAIGVGLYTTWDTWKLKRQTGLRGNNDLISALFKQIVSRLFFVVAFNVTLFILDIAKAPAELLDSFGAIEQSLSAILITGFTLDLRKRNSATSEPSLPAIRSFQGVLQRIHESIVVEMGDNASTDIDLEVEEVDDVSSLMDDMTDMTRVSERSRSSSRDTLV